MQAGQTEAVNDRKCIVTGRSGDADGLIRFVAGPDGMVVPDLKRVLPGRGCWVTATRDHVERAAARNHFARALRGKVTVPADLAALVDRLIADRASGAVLMARKAGDAVSGAARVDSALRAGRVVALVHAVEAAPDGVRKLDQARRATVHLGGPDATVFQLLSAEQLGLAFGGGNAIHAAVLDGQAGHAALRRLRALRDYRAGGKPRMQAKGASLSSSATSAGQRKAVDERIRNE